MAKLIEILKPDLKRIFFLLIIISPIILNNLYNFLPLPAQFDSLNTYLSNFTVQIPFLYSFILLGGHFGERGDPYPGFYILTISFGIIFWYLVSCLIVFSWDNIIGRLGKEKGKHEKIIIKSLIVIFILVTIILPAMGTYFIILEKSTRQNVSFDEALRIYTTTYQVKLQELRIQNHFISLVTYELPNVTACVYDIEGNLKWGYTIAYRTEDGGYVEDRDPYHRNVIVAEPGIETKIYLQNKYRFEEIKNNSEKFDEIILLSNAGMNNYDYCIEATEEDILASENIKISK